MRKSRPKQQPPAPQRDQVFFDRSPSKEKFQIDLDCAIATGYEHGLSGADVVESLLLHAEREASLAKERGEDMSRLLYLVEEVEP
jgi:hypothetical protein